MPPRPLPSARYSLARPQPRGEAEMGLPLPSPTRPASAAAPSTARGGARTSQGHAAAASATLAAAGAADGWCRLIGWSPPQSRASRAAASRARNGSAARRVPRSARWRGRITLGARAGRRRSSPARRRAAVRRPPAVARRHSSWGAPRWALGRSISIRPMLAREQCVHTGAWRDTWRWPWHGGRGGFVRAGGGASCCTLAWAGALGG